MTSVIVVVAVAAVMFAVERVAAGRLWPRVRGWWLRALLFNGVQIGVVFLTGAVFDPALRTLRPWSLDGLGLWGGAAVGYVAVTFVYYWWHRARHASPVLWRWFHQVHHSPRRIEVITSFYKHPFELVANSLLTSAIVYLGVGLSPEAASLTVTFTGLAELFYHWNVRTPYWLGFLVQRPESHCIHHEDGVHGFNYADLPLWDFLFGTLRNPREWNGRCGLGDAEERVGDLLRGVDVSA